MCGICGIVALGRPPEIETVGRMAAELDHRGPDGDGSYSAEGVALGFRRLAIIDLSDAGLQPFPSADGSLQLVHNGEVYNYRELRTELEAKGHRFHSATDTEVILAAYEEWGDRCVERFNGMWAFALWDGRRRRLFCSRDRFGVKPFYYRFDGGRFVFASEPRAFRGDPETRLEPNPRAIRDYLDQAYLDHTEETFFAGSRKLPPAHSLVVDEDGLRLSRYWSLEEHEPPAGDPAEARRSGVTVMIDGQGGDEVLAGYRAHLGFRLADLLAAGRLRELGGELRSFHGVHSASALVTAMSRPFAPEALTRLVRSRTRGAGALVHPDLRGLGSAPTPNGSSFPDRLRRHQQLILTRRGLPELLRYEDRNSMAHSIEARVPFLDYRLVELCFSLPGGELIGGGRTKDVLRRALADLLPPIVRERRDKLGFVTPERLWLRSRLGDLAADVFASRSFAERGFVDAPAARRRLDRHRRGELEAGMELWRALNLELWARSSLDG